jgi:hypothetical protein
MIKFMKKLGLVMVCMYLVLGVNFGVLEEVGVKSVAYAQEQTEADRDGFINDDTRGVLEAIRDITGLPVSGFEEAPGRFDQPGLNRIASLVFSALSVVKYVILGITILYLSISLVRIIGKQDVDEDLDQLKRYVGYLIGAIVIVLTADVIFLQVLDLSGGGFLENEAAAQEAARIGAAEIKGIIRVVEMLVGIIALTFLILSGVRLVANAGDEEAIGKAKNQIIYSIVGIILVLISESLVTEIFFVDDGNSIDASAANRLIVTFTNFVSGFIAIGALLSLLYAGFSYVFNPGSEENAGRVKNAVIGAVVGIVIAAGAFAVVNTVIDLDPNDGAPVPTMDEEFIDSGFDQFQEFSL